MDEHTKQNDRPVPDQKTVDALLMMTRADAQHANTDPFRNQPKPRSGLIIGWIFGFATRLARLVSRKRY